MSRNMEGNSFVEISDAKSGFSHQSGNSKTVSEDGSEESDNLVKSSEEFPLFLEEKQTENRKHKKQAGFFSRLRKNLSLRLSELSEWRLRSSVRVTYIGNDEFDRKGPIIVRKVRTQSYRCVPNPPGCIPTEVMLKAFYSAPLNRLAGLEEKPLAIDGANHEQQANQHSYRNEYKSIQESAIVPSNVRICEETKPTKVLYNNWMDPEL